MQYRCEIDGFVGNFRALSEMQVWVVDLTNRYRLAGKECRIYKAVWVANDGSGAEYSLKHGFFREIIVGV